MKPVRGGEVQGRSSLREFLRVTGYMLASAAFLMLGGLVADVLFPVGWGFGDSFRREWAGVARMTTFALQVYIPAVAVGLLLGALVCRWRHVVVLHEVVAALAGFAVISVPVALAFAPRESLAGGLTRTVHLLHGPTLLLAGLLAVVTSMRPLVRRIRHRKGGDLGAIADASQ